MDMIKESRDVFRISVMILFLIIFSAIVYLTDNPEVFLRNNHTINGEENWSEVITNHLSDNNSMSFGAAIYTNMDSLSKLAKLDLIVMAEEQKEDAKDIYRISRNDLYMYKHIGANKDASYDGNVGDRYHTAVEDFELFIEKHPDWLLTRDGKYVRDPYFDNVGGTVYYIDISRWEVRDYIGAKYTWALNRYKINIDGVETSVYSGVMVDIAPSDLYYYGGPTDQIRTDKEAFESYKDFLIDVKNWLNPEGYDLIVEWSRTVEADNMVDLIPYTDGIYIEGYYTDWKGKKRPQSEIRLQDKYIIESNKYGNKVLLQIWMPEDDNIYYDPEMVKEIYDHLTTLIKEENLSKDNIILLTPHGRYTEKSALVGIEVFQNIVS